MKRTLMNTGQQTLLTDDDEDDTDNDIVLVHEGDEDIQTTQPKKKRKTIRGRNKKQKDEEERLRKEKQEEDNLDKKLISSGFLTADDLVGLTCQEKLDYHKAFMESMGGSQTQDTATASTSAASIGDDDQTVEVTRADSDVESTDADKLLASDDAEENEVGNGKLEIQLSDESLMTDDGILDENYQPDETPKKKSSQKLVSQSTSQNRTPNQPAESPIFKRTVLPSPAKDPADEDDEALAGDQSTRPYFTFECKDDADWPRSPSPSKLSTEKRHDKPTMEAIPMFTPPGYCPRQYTQVIVQSFNDYLDKLYQYQCRTLPRRTIGNSIEVGRCHSGTMDLLRKRPRDLSQKLEDYYDWRKGGGEGITSSPQDGEPCFTYPCDVHGTHSISTVEPDEEKNSEETEFDSQGSNERKRKFDNDLPEIAEVCDEPKPKRLTGNSFFNVRSTDSRKVQSTREQGLRDYRTKIDEFDLVIGSNRPQRNVRRTQDKSSVRIKADDTESLLVQFENADDDDDSDFEVAPPKKASNKGKSPKVSSKNMDFEDMSDVIVGYMNEETATGTVKTPIYLKTVGVNHHIAAAGDATSAVKVDLFDCPICYDKFPAEQLPDHAALCDGTSRAQLLQHKLDFLTKGEDGEILSPASTSRTLRNNKTVSTVLCTACHTHIPETRIESHVAACVAKRGAAMERQARAEVERQARAEVARLVKTKFDEIVDPNRGRKPEKRPKPETANESEDLNLVMSDMSYEEDDGGVRTFVIDDSPDKEPDESGEPAENKEEWLGKEEGRRRAEAAKRNRLRRTK